MSRALLFPCLVFASSALAQAPAPPPAVPTRSIPCAMSETTLLADGTDPVLCWKDGCAKLEFWGANAARVPRPSPAKHWLTEMPRVDKDRVCIGATCKTLGKNVIAALAGARAEGEASIAATSDLKAVTINTTAWNVAVDRQLAFTPPAIYGRERGDKPVTFGFMPAGDLLVVWWSNCAGPCTKFGITDSSGRSKGQEGEGGGGVFQLDAKRFVVYGEYGSIYLYEMGSARPRGSVLHLTTDPSNVSMIRSGDDTILALYSRGDGVEIGRISAYADTPPSLSSTLYMPRCIEPE